MYKNNKTPLTSLKILENLKRLPKNQSCADCLSARPSWVSYNLGIFICINCAGVHRSLSVQISKVKSTTLDNMTIQQTEKLVEIGNSKSNDYYEYYLPHDFKRPSPTNAVGLRQFIRDKYVNCLYANKKNNLQTKQIKKKEKKKETMKEMKREKKEKKETKKIRRMKQKNSTKHKISTLKRRHIRAQKKSNRKKRKPKSRHVHLHKSRKRKGNPNEFIANIQPNEELLTEKEFFYGLTISKKEDDEDEKKINNDEDNILIEFGEITNKNNEENIINKQNNNLEDLESIFFETTNYKNEGSDNQMENSFKYIISLFNPPNQTLYYPYQQQLN
ncbi:adp-ribosylation factor gtpase-activating protein [Anaeramoeba flamelloides]|uniref:Adp-ribosylation factor gtpase-activating protein n=1 Tax=Anaeramoeba flamelloides TaxID=1746091 RepID=A0AAV7Y783_9EUKA|nr:adp-ribosylation factor gtpase-activating protein [Anaeramoeba flamelloides]